MRYCIFCLIAAIVALITLSDHPAESGDPAPKAVNLDKLNTAADEEDPCPSPDGNALLYAVKSQGSYDIFVSRRTTLKAPWTPGKAFIADRVADERGAFLRKEAVKGDTYYFATNEVPDAKFEKLKNFDLMMQIGFQKAIPLLGEINTPADEMYPWITPSGKELYFSRKTEEGWKLFVANGPVPGPIGKANPVGFDAGFQRAAIGGKDALTMYLQGPLENGKIGIFRSKRAKVGEAWTKPEPLAALNHAESKKGDMQPAVTSDGTRLYFASDRPGGKGGIDIWTVSTAGLK